MRSDPPPPPIVLTKIDALAWAADTLERRAANMEIGAIIMETLGTLDITDAPADVRARYQRLRDASVEPDLQITAMRAAAKAIRDQVLEERVVAARVEAGAGIKAKSQ